MRTATTERCPPEEKGTSMRYLDQIDLKNKYVFIRADLNVPLDKTTGHIADDTRIKAALRTVSFALEAGAKVVLASHMGRPKGEPVPGLSLKIVAERVEELLKRKVHFADNCVGEQVQKLKAQLKAGEVLLLENLRFNPGESKNNPEFAKQLAEGIDVYINDAFATAHRAHASTVGIVSFVPVSAAGFTLKDEIEYFDRAFSNPTRPLITIFGGAKVSTKMAAIKSVGQKADVILIGGAMANTFFVADGLSVGKSLFEPEQVDAAREIKATLSKSKCKLVLPVDVIVAAELKSGVPTKAVSVNQIGANDLALDIGPNSVELFKRELQSAKTIIWNGPMGAFETTEFASGTYAIIDALSSSQALTVVGGGDTDLALHRRHAYDKMDYVSTAGGAFLELLEGKELPAVKALS